MKHYDTLEHFYIYFQAHQFMAAFLDEKNGKVTHGSWFSWPTWSSRVQTLINK